MSPEAGALGVATAPRHQPSTRPAPRVSRRIEDFLDAHPDLPTPFLVVDLDVVAERYRSLRSALPQAEVYFAVKANPDPAIIELLTALGSSFDVASVGEIELCLRHGVTPQQLSFGNTIKKERDIAAAYQLGVRTFAADASSELEKIIRQVEDGTVLVRLASECGGADWPLSRKFGASAGEVEALLLRAADTGLDVGISFHVGSQQRDPRAWNAPLAATARLRSALERRGHSLRTVNLGGGLPSSHFAPTPPIADFGREIDIALDRHLGGVDGLHVMVEPGRFIVGDAGLIRAEVVLVTEKATDCGRRWVYLDIGMFNGLVETQQEAIRYRIRCPMANGPTAPAVLAGPTCDSVDILYEREGYPLPIDLAPGHMVDLLSTGAYTTTYSSVWFNGFEPLRSIYLPPTVDRDGALPDADSVVRRRRSNPASDRSAHRTMGHVGASVVSGAA
jgi:ornithine decarboxylase